MIPAEHALMVFETLDRLSSARTMPVAVAILKDAARKLAAADMATVMLRDGAYVQAVGEDSGGPFAEDRLFPLDSCLDGWVILNGKYAVVEDFRNDPRQSSAALPNAPVASAAVFPLRSADPIGTLGVYWTEPHRPDPCLLSALQILANASASVIENARLSNWVEVAYRSARQETQKYSNLVNTVNGVVWEANAGMSRFTFVSNQAERLLGYPLAEWTAEDSFWLDHVHADDRTRVSAFGRHTSLNSDRRPVEYRMIAADGRIVWVADYMSASRRSDNSECLHGVMVDISDQKALEKQLAWQASYDSLTSLPNRALFLDYAERALRRAGNTRQHRVAILYVDLDRFKYINDSFGHLAGDALLMAVASRLRKTARESEIVARLSGDEFAVLAPGAGNPEQARGVAERIHAVFSRPFRIAGSSLWLSASIGIALDNGIPRSARELVREADTAMYLAKREGRARSEFFDASMHDNALGRLRLECELRNSVKRREFELHYQPIVDLNTHKVVGCEALLRWPHPTRGLLLPAEFLAAADDVGLMVELGYDTLAKAGATLGRWGRYDGPRPWLSVNLSPAQLNDPRLLRRVRQVLDSNSIPPQSLKLEITEAGLVQSEAAVRERLGQLHELGVGILIDDFGTGMSSFGRLLNAPVETIKIDRSFTAELTTPDCDAPLLRSIIVLARNLKVGLIAEGVENEEQAQGLRQLGCDIAQGFYLARPRPLEQAEMMMA